MIGEFATRDAASNSLVWSTEGTILLDGSALLRELNRRLGLSFPLLGPKTLNGLILEHLQDIPEAGISLKIAGCAMDIVQTEDRVVRTVRLTRPAGANLRAAASLA